MTEQEISNRVDILGRLEKSALKSKKFIAWFIMQCFMFSMALVALLKQPTLGWPLSAFMTGIVFSMCVSTMWLLGKQAASDIAVRGFAFLADPRKAVSGTDDTTPSAPQG